MVQHRSRVLFNRRHISIYAENPDRWRNDPLVAMYGQLLGVKDEQHESFVVAANSLREMRNLPADLRASAARVKASVLFKLMVQKAGALKLDLAEPWPLKDVEEALEAATRACTAYEEAIAESTEPALLEAVAVPCPDWGLAVSGTRKAHVEARKLRAEIRARRVQWLSRQARLAREAMEAAQRGDSLAGTEAADGLALAGLSRMVEEEEVRLLAVIECERMLEECLAVLVDDSEARALLKEMRARGQASLVIALKDLSIAYAMGYKLETSVQYILRALRIELEDPDAISNNVREQLRAAAEGIVELCTRTDIKGGAGQDPKAQQWGLEIGMAVAEFNMWGR